MMKTLTWPKRVFFSLVLMLGSQLIGANPIYSQPDSSLLVSRHLGSGFDSNIVILKGGSSQGVMLGDVFIIKRPSRRGVMESESLSLATGTVKVIQVGRNDSIAEVQQQGSFLGQKAFGVYAQVMAGDFAQKQIIKIEPRQGISPIETLAYKSLFVDAKRNPSSMDLSIQGKNLLKEVAERYSDRLAGKLLITGFTDRKGASSENQVESQQRALIVKHYLVTALGFDEDRLQSIGKGEMEDSETNITATSEDDARRIEIKILPPVQGKGNTLSQR